MVGFVPQLFCHLIGDYFLQTDYIATNKKKYWQISLLHAFSYASCFVVLNISVWAFVVIFLTHWFIDGTNIVAMLNQYRNQDFIGCDSYGNKDGFGDRPDHIRHWLLIIQDNTLHLIINYFAIMYL